jgi:hypothetical protein
MVTMVDEIYDRHYQAARSDLNASIISGLGRLGDAVANAFKVLNRIEYQAPWTIRSRRVRFN